MTVRTVLIATRKLYSQKGTLLGTISYPEHWDRPIQEHGSVIIRFAPGGSGILPYHPMNMECRPSLIRTFIIHESYQDRGAVAIQGVTIEEFEQMRDCSFSPSATYIRSLLT